MLEVGNGLLEAVGERDFRLPFKSAFALEKLRVRCRGSSWGSGLKMSFEREFV